MAKIPPPLDASHLAQIKDHLETLDSVQQHIDTAVRAGINMEDQQKRLVDTKQKLLQLKNTYFPNS